MLLPYTEKEPLTKGRKERKDNVETDAKSKRKESI